MLERTWAIGFGLSLAVSACGGAGGGHAKSPGALTDDQIDADPIALLPVSPIAVANIDAHAFYTSGTVGAQLAALSEKVVPIGDEAGFKASRDVDRVVAGVYGAQGVDSVAILSGRFDESKITQAADAHKTTKAGGAIVESDYAGRHVFTVADAGVVVLTPKTALAGTQAAVRRALDRVASGSAKRELPSWMLDTLATPNAAAAAAADFSQPAASAAIGSIPLSAAKGVKTARLVADFKAPGMHVAMTLEYTDASSAASAASNLKQSATLEGLAAFAGLAPKLQDVAIAAAESNVEASFAVDDASLRKIIRLIPQLVGSR